MKVRALFTKKMLLWVFVICQILCLHFLQSQIKAQAVSIPGEQLFRYSVEDKSEEEVSEAIQSSSNDIQMLTGLMDNEISKKILGFSNSEVTSGKKLEVDFINLDVPIDNNMNVRLKIDYFRKVGDPAILRTDTLRFRIKIENNGEESFVGPFKIIDSVPTGVYEAESKPFWNFELISENIELTAGDHITKIEIVPIATQPNGSDGSFCINGIELSSYADQNYDDGIEREYQDREEVRKSIVRRMYDLATIKWTPKEVDGVDGIYGNNTASSSPTSKTLHYLSGTYYYGIPYGQRNSTTLERFASLVENSVYNYDEGVLEDIVWNENGTIRGFRVGYGRRIETLQCATSTFEAMSAFLPFHVAITGPSSFVWNNNIERVLGGLEYPDADLTWDDMISNPNEPTKNTNDFVEINGNQKIYEGYAELKIGDAVSSYPVGQHVRLVTGDPVVVRNSDGTIDPVNSYVIATEIWGIIDGYGNKTGEIIEEDQVGWVPNPKYTDIETIQDLYGKSVTWRVNKKFTFADLIDQQAYVPIRMLALDSDEVEKPYFRIINANTVDDVRDGLKGTLVSNYEIGSVTYIIENLTEGTKYISTEYPAKSTDPQIGSFRNVYSLFRRTSEDVQEAVKSIGPDDEFKITISVSTGAKEGVALILSNVQNPVVDPDDGDDDVISVPNTGKGDDKNLVENVAIVLMLIPIVLGSITIILNKTVFHRKIGFIKKM